MMPNQYPDWNREYKRLLQWEPSRSLLASIRAWERHQHSNIPGKTLFSKWDKLRHRIWTTITGADIPINCTIGGGLLLPHPNGVIIHKDARIGCNCMIMQQVTIGQLAGGATPVIGDNVYIGAGAKILGGIHIGERAAIGANAVVLKDVPAGATAVGIPARIVKTRP